MSHNDLRAGLKTLADDIERRSAHLGDGVASELREQVNTQIARLERLERDEAKVERKRYRTPRPHTNP